MCTAHNVVRHTAVGLGVLVEADGVVVTADARAQCLHLSWIMELESDCEIALLEASAFTEETDSNFNITAPPTSVPVLPASQQSSRSTTVRERTFHTLYIRAVPVLRCCVLNLAA